MSSARIFQERQQTSKEMFEVIDTFFKENDLEWKSCSQICTDGVAAVTGRVHRLLGCMKKVYSVQATEWLAVSKSLSRQRLRQAAVASYRRPQFIACKTIWECWGSIFLRAPAPPCSTVWRCRVGCMSGLTCWCLHQTEWPQSITSRQGLTRCEHEWFSEWIPNEDHNLGEEMWSPFSVN